MTTETGIYQNEDKNLWTCEGNGVKVVTRKFPTPYHYAEIVRVDGPVSAVATFWELLENICALNPRPMMIGN